MREAYEGREAVRRLILLETAGSIADSMEEEGRAIKASNAAFERDILETKPSDVSATGQDEMRITAARDVHYHIHDPVKTPAAPITTAPITNPITNTPTATSPSDPQTSVLATIGKALAVAALGMSGAGGAAYLLPVADKAGELILETLPEVKEAVTK